MKTRSRILFASAVFALLSFVVLLTPPRPISFGQQTFPPTNRHPACGCYVCGLLLSVDFPDKAPDCVGILATDACPVEMAKLPVEKRKVFCQKLKERSKNESMDECLILRGACDDNSPPENETKCENPTPWTDRSRQCTDAQAPKTELRQRVISVSMCGATVFRFESDTEDALFLEAQRGAIHQWVMERVGSKVCCDRFRDRDAGCDPRTDFDCDGKNNQTDVVVTSGATYPDFGMGYVTGNGASIDPFPPGTDPNAPDFRPEGTARNSKGVGECACKWELVKGKMSCSLDRTQRHFYTATWRCPATKAEVTTIKYFPGTSPCSAKSGAPGSHMAWTLSDFGIASGTEYP